MNTHSETGKTRAEKVAEILKANSKKLIALSVTLLLVLVLIGFYETISSKKAEKALLHAEQIEDVYKQWITSAEADQDTVSEELSALIAEALSDFDGSYAALRAYYTKGLLNAEEEKWDDSIAAFLAVTEQFPSSYLAPVALFNAASIADQSGDTEKALSLYESIIEKFSDSSTDIPETLFNIGRLNEELGNADNAVVSYQRILDDYNSSSWTNIAKSRIISINANS